MKTITLAHLETLLQRKDWKRETNLEFSDFGIRYDYRQDPKTGECEEVEIPHTYGYATLTSTLEGVTIIYQESFSFDDHEEDTFYTSTEGPMTVWEVSGAVVVDEDGDTIPDYDACEDAPGQFYEIDYSGIDFDETNDTDLDEESDMETITIRIDNEPNIRFSGEILASASSSDNNASGSSYSGETGRWSELALYKTAGGKYVCESIGRTRWQGERDRFSGEVCDNLDEVKAFFGHRWLAKDLYEEAGIDDSVEVD